MLTLLSACVEPSLSQKGLSSEQVEEVATSQGSKVRMHSHVAQPLVASHQGVTSASSPTIQVHSQPAGGGSDLPKEPDTATVKGECRVNTVLDRGGGVHCSAHVHCPLCPPISYCCFTAPTDPAP